MIIKPLETMVEATSAARRISQRPPAFEAPPPVPTQLTGGAPEQQPRAAEPRQQEAAEAQTQAHPQNPMLRFHVDPDTGKTIAELVDMEGQVLRQMPTEEALEIAKAIGKYQGMFVDLKV